MSFMKKLKALRVREDGFTLLELLLVVGVGAVLLLAGIGTYQLVTEGNKANEANRLLNSIKQKVQTAYQGQTTYGVAGTNLNATLVTMGIFPAQFLDPGQNPVHPWNGPIVVTAQASQFEIEFQALTEDQCVAVAILPVNDDPDFVSVDIAGANTYTATPFVTPVNAAADCAGGGNVAWTFF